MDERARQARRFAAGAGWADADLAPLAGDASARRYFRLTRGDGQSVVLMDAPPGTGVDIAPFVRIATHLAGSGFSAPEVLARDDGAGFLLLEDFGDAVFARVIEADPTREMPLYAAAADVLIALDGAEVPGFVRQFDPAVMADQVAPAYSWYRAGMETEMPKGFEQIYAELETVLSENSLGQPTLLLRDFHAENLIWLPGRAGVAQVGLLDFQDAMAGPPGYDLASLLYDARRDVADPVRTQILDRFAQGTGRDPGAVRAAVAAIGVQRNLRILGVFARLATGRGKPRYLDLLPRVWRDLNACLDHPALRDLAPHIRSGLPAPVPAHLQRLRDMAA